MKNYRYGVLMLAGCALPALTATGIRPATAQTDQSATGSRLPALEEIVVTARKREEVLQKVPVAITAFSGDQMTHQGIQTAADLGKSVASLRSLTHPAQASVVSFTLRGQSAGDVLQTIDQSVGLYVDGVYIARPYGLNAGFFDLARVEVVKGPQGTLYGRNTTGGAINFISKGADYRGLHGFVAAEAGNFDDLKLGAAVNLPVIEDRLALRIAYQRWQRDGFGRSATTGQDIGQQRNQHFLRASVLADPAPGLNIVLKGEYYRSRENGNFYTPRYIIPTGNAVTEAMAELGLPRDQALAVLQDYALRGTRDIYTTFYEAPQHDDIEAVTLGGTITLDVSDAVRIKSITGYRWFRNDQSFDVDATPFRVVEVGVGRFPDVPAIRAAPGQPLAAYQSDVGPRNEPRFFSQEFNLSGSLFADRLNWLVGYYYSHEKGNQTEQSQSFPAILTTMAITDGSNIVNDSWSIFSQNDFKIMDRLTVTLGGRYTKESKVLDSRSRTLSQVTGMIACSTGVAGTYPASNPDACLTHQSAKFSGWSWLASLNWQATDDLLVYLKSARGFRGGTFQVRFPTLAPAGPETATDIEAGLKGDFFDGRLRTNIAAFVTDYKNKQEAITVLSPTGAAASIIQNAASARLKGVEAEVTFRPMTGLTIGGTLTYFEGRYRSFKSALPIQGCPTATPTCGTDASGERLGNPPWSYSISARYETDLGGGTLGFGADWSYTSAARPSARLTDPNIPLSVLETLISACTGGSSGSNCSNGRADLGLLNGRIDYRLPDDRTTIAIFATNLLNKAYQFAGTAAPSIGGVQVGVTGEPRMWGLQLRHDFGAGE
ncbi:MAG: TonB-dependent receptor [Sphingobium sp.]